MPVSTIALSGVITRMPLVCMSIVASAFQYGWAPTLMPVTTTLTSWPAWVNSMMRRSTTEIQSMFSVPLSIAIRAPADRANHSSGTLERLGEVEGGDDAPALRLGQRAEGLGGVTEQGHANDAVRVTVGDGGDEADDDAGGVPAWCPIDQDEAAAGVEIVLHERAARDVGAPARPRRHELLHQLVGVGRSAPAGLHHLLGVLVDGLQRLGRQVLLDHREPGPGRVGQTDESLAQLTGGRIGAQALHRDLVDPQALRRRRQTAGDSLDVLDGEVERRPDVEQHGVQLVAALRRERGLDPAHALERVDQHPLELRQCDDAALLVAHGCQVADLAERQQALVLRIAVGDGAVR